ncbi:hypothetical protein MalM25_19460 [Planctomycetes bacterium MalM25]|nr:hypothetical protein MalM25_19460 [Planctomycetes bacterium MalM25]
MLLRLALGCALLIAGDARSELLPVVNPGFEDVSGSAALFNEFSFGAPIGWQVYDDPAGLIGVGASSPYYVGTLGPQPDPMNPGGFIYFPAGAPEGERVAIAYNRAGSGGTGAYGLEQTLTGTPLRWNRRHTLRVEVGNIASGPALSGEFFNLDGFPGYRIELLAGGQVVAADNSSLSGTIGEGEFATSTVVLTTWTDSELGSLIGTDLGVRLVNPNEIDPTFPAADLEVDFDNVRLDVSPALNGDFNFDGLVDAADFTVWRDGEGAAISGADYLAWRDNYGATAPVELPAGAIPEPATGGSILLVLSVLPPSRRPPM